MGDAGEAEEVATRDKVRQWAPAVFSYLLWIAVFTSAQMLLTSTIEEKSVRIMEILVSSLSPAELLAGKVIGVAGAGMIVVGSWTLCALVGMLVLTHVVGSAARGLVQVTPIRTSWSPLPSTSASVTCSTPPTWSAWGRCARA